MYIFLVSKKLMMLESIACKQFADIATITALGRETLLVQTGAAQ